MSINYFGLFWQSGLLESVSLWCMCLWRPQLEYYLVEVSHCLILWLFLLFFWGEKAFLCLGWRCAHGLQGLQRLHGVLCQTNCVTSFLKLLHFLGGKHGAQATSGNEVEVSHVVDKVDGFLSLLLTALELLADFTGFTHHLRKWDSAAWLLWLWRSDRLLLGTSREMLEHLLTENISCW